MRAELRPEQVRIPPQICQLAQAEHQDLVAQSLTPALLVCTGQGWEERGARHKVPLQ